MSCDLTVLPHCKHLSLQNRHGIGILLKILPYFQHFVKPVTMKIFFMENEDTYLLVNFSNSNRKRKNILLFIHK